MTLGTFFYFISQQVLALSDLSLEQRMERVRTVYGENPDNMPNYVKKRDKQRSDYYNHFTMNRFGDYRNFDACMNTSIGLELTTDILENTIRGVFGGAEDASRRGNDTGK